MQKTGIVCECLRWDIPTPRTGTWSGSSPRPIPLVLLSCSPNPKSIAKISPRPGAARPSLTVRAASSQRAGEQFLAAGTERWLAHELLWKCVSKYSLSPLLAADCHTHSNVVPRESCDFVQLVLTIARIERRCGDQPQQISARQMRLVIGS